MKAIEPSEIILTSEGTIKSQTKGPFPWTRFWARLFDYAFFCGLLWLVKGIFHYSLPLKRIESLIPYEYLAWVPLEAALLCSIGTTPGKWILKVSLAQGRKKRLDFGTALKRSFSVWLQGVGLGIPVVNLLCMAIAYQYLKIHKTTKWDSKEHMQVAYGFIGQMRLRIVAALSMIGLILYQFYGRNV